MPAKSRGTSNAGQQDAGFYRFLMRYCRNMMQQILPILLVFACSGLSAQDIPFIKTDQIERWKNADTDTVYVFNFWATWCGPCVEEMPEFIKLDKTYADQKVKVMLISTDFKRNVESGVKPFVRKKKIENLAFFMDEPNPNNYINAVDSTWSGAIPATLVWSKRKGVSQFFEKKLTYEELEAAVKKAL
jgi:thiol-disulfide isomerase/thioredoxin